MLFITPRQLGIVPAYAEQSSCSHHVSWAAFRFPCVVNMLQACNPGSGLAAPLQTTSQTIADSIIHVVDDAEGQFMKPTELKLLLLKPCSQDFVTGRSVLLMHNWRILLDSHTCC